MFNLGKISSFPRVCSEEAHFPGLLELRLPGNGQKYRTTRLLHGTSVSWNTWSTSGSGCLPLVLPSSWIHNSFSLLSGETKDGNTKKSHWSICFWHLSLFSSCEGEILSPVTTSATSLSRLLTHHNCRQTSLEPPSLAFQEATSTLFSSSSALCSWPKPSTSNGLV